ncbi:MAG: hypothetical protein QXM92_02030 [Candidatus Anstonellales archaeon]
MGMSSSNPKNNSSSNNSSNNNSNKDSSNSITLGPYRINKNKAVARSTVFNFLNPAEDFLGIVECLGNIRHIEKRGEMKQDLDVIDCKIITGVETREVEEETPNGTWIRNETIQYNNENVSLVLSKAVLLSKFKELQKELADLTGKRIVIVGLGKAEDKNYYDYYVATEEKAVQDGVLQIMKQVDLTNK